MSVLLPTRDGFAGVVDNGVEVDGRLYALYAFGFTVDCFEGLVPTVSTEFPSSGEFVCVVPGCDVIFDVPCEQNVYYVPKGERC